MQNLQNSCPYFLVQGFQSGPARGPQFTYTIKMATAKLENILPKSANIEDLLKAAMPQELYRAFLHFYKI